jgi:hypothetical protein
MPADPNQSRAPAALSETAQNQADPLLATGLADFTLRELWGLLISGTGRAERQVSLEKTAADKANGV